MPALTPAQILQAWDRGADGDKVVRAVTLAAVATDRTVAEASDLTLGARDALLIDLRVACFGADLDCVTRCPACGQELDVAVPASDLKCPAAAQAQAAIDVGGRQVCLRPLTSRDVLAVDPADDDPRRQLVRRCIVEVNGAAPRTGDLSDDLVAAAASALARLDPQADLRLDLTCAVCGHAWTAPFDVPAQLWTDVDTCARQLLSDVHALARAYGWREDDILALTPARRRFYLQAVGT